MSVTLDTKRSISLDERCDMCSAQAKVRSTLLNGELYFCGHHARELGYKLVLKSVEVYDPEEFLNYDK